MRASAWFVAILLPLLVACKLLPQNVDQPAPVATAQDVGSADSPGIGLRPKPRPISAEGQAAPVADGAAVAQAPAAAAPAPLTPLKSKDQIACERQNGSWVNAGKSQSKTCVKRTRDAGKQCKKQGDCDSVCLARSGTCAPAKPLFGCNEILQKDGSRVTLCID